MDGLALGIAYLWVMLISVGIALVVWAISPFGYRRAWSYGYWFMVMTFLVGALIVVAWPLWLAPPHFQDTGILYFGLLFLWYPVLLICVFLSARNLKLRYLFAAMLAGLAAATVVLGVSPAPGFASMNFGPDDCTKSANGEAVYYNCRHVTTIILGAWVYTYTLSGQVGSPFVQVDAYDETLIDS